MPQERIKTLEELKTFSSWKAAKGDCEKAWPMKGSGFPVRLRSRGGSEVVLSEVRECLPHLSPDHSSILSANGSKPPTFPGPVYDS